MPSSLFMRVRTDVVANISPTRKFRPILLIKSKIVQFSYQSALLTNLKKEKKVHFLFIHILRWILIWEYRSLTWHHLVSHVSVHSTNIFDGYRIFDAAAFSNTRYYDLIRCRRGHFVRLICHLDHQFDPFRHQLMQSDDDRHVENVSNQWSPADYQYANSQRLGRSRHKCAELKLTLAPEILTYWKEPNFSLKS